MTVKDSYYVKINSVNPLYLIISKADGYTKKKKKRKKKNKSGCKYLVFNSASENNGVLKKYNEFWDWIKNKNETINDSKTSKHSSAEHDKDF